MESNFDAAFEYLLEDHQEAIKHGIPESFDPSIRHVLLDEGGWAERENEPGGAVHRGISFLVFQEMWAKEAKLETPGIKMHPGKPTFDDLHNLTEDETKYLYKKYIFSQVGFDKLPAGLDYLMVNTATMQGPTGAIRLLQEALGGPVTGKLNPDTWKAINEHDPEALINGVLFLQAMAKMEDQRVGKWNDKHGKEQRGFGPGWAKRLRRVRDRSIKLTEHK